MADCRGKDGGLHGGMDPSSLVGIILIVSSICSLVLDWEPIKTPDLTSLGFLGNLKWWWTSRWSGFTGRHDSHCQLNL